MIKQLFKSDRKCLRKFIFTLGMKGLRSFNRYRRRLKRGDFFPAFHFISVTDDCNLQCQGCWVTHKKHNHSMSPEMLDQIIIETKAKGSYFFGILGGEPLMYKPLMDVFEKHNDCYFQLFTNGTLLTNEVAQKLRKVANVTPLISVEGDEVVADERRNGTNVYKRTFDGIDNATANGLITGVAMSVCKTNLQLALSPDFINSLIKKGVIYLWYYIYRPVGQDSNIDLALSKEEIEQLRHFMINARTKFKILLIDTYWDGLGNGLCPAAAGLSHHINTHGDIEPCPIIQFATESAGIKPLGEIYRDSAFLRDFRKEIPPKTKGCVVMGDPQWLVNFVEKHNARDTSGRDNEIERLRQMPTVISHGSIEPVKEKSWIYRFAKKKAFFGLGAYG